MNSQENIPARNEQAAQDGGSVPGPVMPGDGQAGGGVDAGPAPPTPFAVQVGQLVVIPAVIVVVCVGLAVMFGVLAGAHIPFLGGPFTRVYRSPVDTSPVAMSLYCPVRSWSSPSRTLVMHL